MNYVAMNRFKVLRGNEAQFEETWLKRESYLHELPGFLEFRFLRGAVNDEYALYSSYTLWASEADFKAWLESDQFKKSHARIPKPSADTPSIYAGPSEFEGFTDLQTIFGTANAVAAE